MSDGQPKEVSRFRYKCQVIFILQSKQSRMRLHGIQCQNYIITIFCLWSAYSMINTLCCILHMITLSESVGAQGQLKDWIRYACSWCWCLFPNASYNVVIYSNMCTKWTAMKECDHISFMPHNLRVYTCKWEHNIFFVLQFLSCGFPYCAFMKIFWWINMVINFLIPGWKTPLGPLF